MVLEAEIAEFFVGERRKVGLDGVGEAAPERFDPPLVELREGGDEGAVERDDPGAPLEVDDADELGLAEGRRGGGRECELGEHPEPGRLKAVEGDDALIVDLDVKLAGVRCRGRKRLFGRAESWEGFGELLWRKAEDFGGEHGVAYTSLRRLKPKEEVPTVPRVSTKSAGVRFYENVHGIYFDDLDAFQILHNARYLLLMERTIGSFWQRLGWGSWKEMRDNPDAYHLVRANHIEYLRPVVGTGEVRVRIWIERLGETSLTFGFCVMPMDEDVDYAAGTRVLVRVDPKGRRPASWTEGFREKVTPYLRRERDGQPAVPPEPVAVPELG